MFQLRVVAAAIGGAIRAAARRVRRGPTLPSWPWSLELLVGAFRASSVASVDHLELLAPGPRGLPRVRPDRGPLHVEELGLGGVPATRFTLRDTGSDGPTGTLLYLHGGGYVSGSVNFERRPAQDHARTTGCDTYSIEYRLAPRHPYHAALDDATTAYPALLERGADPARTLIFGGSAGAGLAAALLLIIAGGAETLRSGAQRLAENARAAGVDTQFSVYPEQPHGWLMLPKLPASVAATEEIRRCFLDRLDR